VLSISAVDQRVTPLTHRRTGGVSPGILLMTGAMLVVPFMDAAAKLLSSRYPVLQLVWARFFFHFLLVLPVVLYRHGTTALSAPRPVLQLGRGLFLLLATGCFFAAIAFIPLADAIAIIFFDAVIVVALAPWVLRERVPPNRWAAAAIGFVAVLLIMRPGLAGFHWASLLALAAALFWALYFLSTRMLTGETPPLVMLGWQSVAGFVLMTLLLPWFWVTPSFEDLLLMLVIGAAGAAGCRRRPTLRHQHPATQPGRSRCLPARLRGRRPRCVGRPPGRRFRRRSHPLRRLRTAPGRPPPVAATGCSF